jgi:alpha/beta superfamily hydrolase
METEFIIKTKDVDLQARFQKGSSHPNTCVLIAHPYGPLGGNLHNNVVVALCRAFVALGFSTLRYNSRGVGKSGGRTSWNGLPEVEDLVNLCTYVTDELQQGNIVLCGYSYGSVSTLAAACEIKSLKAIISISYPIGGIRYLRLCYGLLPPSTRQSSSNQQLICHPFPNTSLLVGQV